MPPPTESELPASPPAVADSPAGLNQGQRPILLPSSAAELSPALLTIAVLVFARLIHGVVL